MIHLRSWRSFGSAKKSGELIHNKTQLNQNKILHAKEHFISNLKIN